MANNEQIESIVKITGLPEEEVTGFYNRLAKHYPAGYLTTTDFEKLLHENELFIDKKLRPSKALFRAADKNKSGNVEFDEYIIALASLGKEDDRTFMKECLFYLFDPEEKGSINRENVITTFVGFNNEGDEEVDVAKFEEQAKQIMKGRTTLTADDFEQTILENEELQSLGVRVLSVFMMAMLFTDEDFQ